MAKVLSAERTSPITRANYVSVGNGKSMSKDKEYDPLQALGNLVGNPEAHASDSVFDQEFEIDLESELTRGLEENNAGPAVEEVQSSVLAEVDVARASTDIPPLVSTSDEPAYSKPVLQSFEDLKSAFEGSTAENVAPASDVVWIGDGFQSADVGQFAESADEPAGKVGEPAPQAQVIEEVSQPAAEFSDREPVGFVQAPEENLPEGEVVYADFDGGIHEEAYAPNEPTSGEGEDVPQILADMPLDEEYAEVEPVSAQVLEPELAATEGLPLEVEPDVDGALDDALAAEFEAAMANDAEDLAGAAIPSAPVPSAPVEAEELHLPPVTTPFDVQVDTALDEMQASASSDDAELGWSGELAGELEQIVADSPSENHQLEDGNPVYAAAVDTPSAEVPATILAFKDEFASDIEVGMNDDAVASPEPDVVAARQKSKGGMRAAAVLLGVAVVGASAAFGWSFFSDAGKTSPAQIILASTDKVKVKPKEPGGKKIPNQNLLVYQKVNGKPESKPKQVRLASGTEKPVRVVSTSPVAPVVKTAKTQKPTVRVSAEDTILQRSESAIVTPRKVRTVLIRPDGTIITRPNAKAAPAKAAPVKVAVNKEASMTPAVSRKAVRTTGAVVSKPKPVKVVSLKPVAKPVRKAGSATIPGVVMPKTDPASAASPRVVKTAPPRIVKTKVPARPARAQPKKAAAPRVVNTAKPKAKPAAVAPVVKTASAGGYVMQIASRRSAEAAQTSYNQLSRKFSRVLGGRGVDIRRFKLKGKGIYYRVRIPAGDKRTAVKLCQRYKSAGGSCFVTR